MFKKLFEKNVGLVIFLIIAHILFIRCKEGEIEISNDLIASNEFYGKTIEVDTLTLKVDSLTVLPENSQLIQNDSILFFFNKSLWALEFHHLYQVMEPDRIYLEKEGPDGVMAGSGLGFYYFSEDTLLATSVNNLILLNKKGKVFQRTKLDVDGLGSLPDIMIQGTKPVYKQKNNLILAVFPHLDVHKKRDLKNWKNFLLVDLESGKAESFGQLPEKMRNNIYGINYLNFSHVFNSDNEILVSFSPLKNFYRIRLNELEKLEEIELSNIGFSDAPSLKNESNSDMQNVLTHYLLNNSFDALYFNGSQYLRITQNFLPENDYDSRSWAKTKNIVLFDSDFNLLSYWNTGSKSISYNMVYPTRNGFLLRINSVVENELRFIVLKNL
jgi:hypothetical protein